MRASFGGGSGICGFFREFGRSTPYHWWDTTHTFHFHFGELTMTPLDFHMLSGLPVSGDHIVVDCRMKVTVAGIRAALGESFPFRSGNSLATSEF